MRYFYLCCLYALFSACNSTVEGCNDPIAKNYNAEADVYCCCVYHQVKFNLRHRINDSTNLALFTDYAPSAGSDSFELQSAKMLFYSIQLIDSVGNAHEIEDSVIFTFNNGVSHTTPDDYTNINTAAFILESGKFTRKGSYTALRFSVGLAPYLQAIDPGALASTDVLTGFYNADAEQYLSQQFSIILPAQQDTFFVRMTDSVNIELPINLEVLEHTDIIIPLDIRYDLLWQGINWAQDDSLSIVQKIKTNTHNAFIIR